MTESAHEDGSVEATFLEHEAVAKLTVADVLPDADAVFISTS